MAAPLDPTLSDPLLSLRRAIAARALPTPTTSAELSTEHTVNDLARATYLYFPHPIPHSIPLGTATRFVSAASDAPVDLRSIFFAWLKKDVAIPEYIASAQELNDTLATHDQDENQHRVLNLVFVERLDLITWLEGASDESEYITPLEGALSAAVVAPGAGGDVSATLISGVPGAAAGAAAGSSAVVAGTIPSAAGVAVAASGVQGIAAGGRLTKAIDPRLQEIYNGERKLGDRNTVLRGIKPTDFSHVRKTAELFLGRNRSRTGQYPPGAKASGASTSKQHRPLPTPSAGLALPKKPGVAATPTAGAGAASGAPGTSSSRRPDPIILLSPSASSLIRMSNIRSFLEDGVFIPPDHPSVATTTVSNILQIVRPLRLSADTGSSHTALGPGVAGTTAAAAAAAAAAAKKPMRFILVDSTANFKPDYWSRLVAVFTTGQTWQFKSYKWTTGHELFKHATGIYVGWRGEDLPREVRGWGRGVKTFAVERWDEKGGRVHGAGRWRDREVVEGIWMAIEEGMRARGWGSGK